MKKMTYAMTVFSAVIAVPAVGAEYLSEVTSEVYPTQGTAKEIATRAMTCISQHLSPGTTDSQLIISSDLDTGVIVARSAAEYGGLVRWQIRSRFTLEARDGRFRILQTNLERFYDSPLPGNSSWGPIGKWSGSGWKKAEEVFATSASKVAECATNLPAKAEW